MGRGDQQSVGLPQSMFNGAAPITFSLHCIVHLATLFNDTHYCQLFGQVFLYYHIPSNKVPGHLRNHSKEALNVFDR